MYTSYKYLLLNVETHRGIYHIPDIKYVVHISELGVVISHSHSHTHTHTHTYTHTHTHTHIHKHTHTHRK